MTGNQITIAIFAAAVFATVFLALQSHKDSTAKLSLVLVGSWAGTLLANREFGPTNAPYVHIAADTLAGLLTLGLAARYRSWCAAAVLLLYVMMDSWHLGAFVYGTESTRPYKLGLNVLCAIQLFVVSAAGAAQWCYRSADRLGGSRLELVPRGGDIARRGREP